MNKNFTSLARLRAVGVTLLFSSSFAFQVATAAVPVADPITSQVLTNPGSAMQVRVADLTGSDPEDGAYTGDGTHKIQIQSLANNGTLFYNGTPVILGQVINNYQTNLLTLDPIDGAVTATFNYRYIDANNNVSADAPVSIPFRLALVKSCAGTNLLLNPSFETNVTGTDVMYTGFTPANWVSADYAYHETSWILPDGTSFVGIHVSGASIHQDVAATVGKTYSMTFYSSMHEPTINNGQVTMQYLDAGSNPIGSPSVHTVTEDWEFTQTLSGPYSLSLAAAPANASFVRVSVLNNAVAGNAESVKADAFCLTETNPMPVTLASFAVKKESGSTLLNWSTTFETNSEYFDVERSTDGKNWGVLGKVMAGGESKDIMRYAYTDASPMTGENLYRLKMVDLDKSFTYSKIQSLTFANLSDAIQIYPNPSSDRLLVKTRNGQEIKSVVVMDMKGREILELNQIPESGIDLKGATAGVYFVKITYTNGSAETRKLVKN